MWRPTRVYVSAGRVRARARPRPAVRRLRLGGESVVAAGGAGGNHEMREPTTVTPSSADPTSQQFISLDTACVGLACSLTMSSCFGMLLLAGGLILPDVAGTIREWKRPTDAEFIAKELGFKDVEAIFPTRQDG